MKKKLATIALATAAVAALSIGGTLSYLQDEARADNTMIFGNVSIANHEYERVKNSDGTYKVIDVTKADGTKVQSYELKEFTQNKPLFPATGKAPVWDSTPVRFEQIAPDGKASGGQNVFAGLNNVQDKFVVVENTGKSDAYVRTLIAMEVGTRTQAKDPYGVSTGDFWTWTNHGIVTINGNNYILREAVYKGAKAGNQSRHDKGILTPGDFTYNSFAQVYLGQEVTSEDIVAMDGNQNGKCDILVLSQAVQVEGFNDAKTALDTAFGVVNQENVAKWFAPQVVNPGQ